MLKVLPNGFTVEYQRVANIFLFADDDGIPQPQVPKFYIESQDRWVENPDHPVYYEAKIAYQIQKSRKGVDKLIEKYVTISNDFVTETHRKTIKKFRKLNHITQSDEFIFLKYVVLVETATLDSLIEDCVLTENRVMNYFSPIQILRYGESIHNYNLKHTVNTGIDYPPVTLSGFQVVHPLDEYNACIKSNMRWDSWLRNEYTLDEMATTVALHRLNRLTEIHSDDAVQTESEKKNK